jgi:O-antigen/teichoic acid export membrane protein
MQPEPNKARRLAINSVYSVLSWVFPLALALIATPILISRFGTDNYGIYMLILGFVNYFFTYGIGKSAAKYVAEFSPQNKVDLISKIVSASLLINISVAGVVAGALAIASRIIVRDIFNIGGEIADTAQIALLIACVTVVAAIPGQIFQYVLQGLHRFDKYVLIVNTGAVLLAAGNIAIAVWHPDIVALLIWNLVITFISTIAAYIIAKRTMPELRFTFNIAGEPTQLVWRYTLSILGYQVFGNLLLLFERTWIVRNFGAESLTHYVVPMTLAMYIHIFAGSLVLAIFPLVNELLDDPGRMRRLYERSTKLILALAVFSAVTAFAAGDLFLTLWLGRDFAAASTTLLLIHVCTFALLAVNTVVWQISESFRAASLNAFATMGWTMIAIPAMVLLSSEFAERGVATGRLAGVLVFIMLIVAVERRFLGGGTMRFWPGSLLKAAAAGGSAFLAEFLLIRAVSHNWLTLVAAGIVGGAVFTGVLWVLKYLNSNEIDAFKRIAVRES